MPDFHLVECWIRQAEADLGAALVPSSEISESHRRYGFQQCYEKAVKAYGLLKFQADDPAQERIFTHEFLRAHGPFSSLEGEAFGGRLQRFVYQLRALIFSIDHASILRRIDESIPKVDPGVISYRYPFIDPETGTFIAPVHYDGWDAYQGNALGVRRALEHLLRNVRDELIISRRRPS